MPAKIRWGILGTGAIASPFAQGLGLAGGELLAVASRTRSRADAFAARFGVPRVYDRGEALVRDPDVDVVYVATPNAEHRASSLLCIEAGKAVLCEKPFALDANEAKEVIDAATRRRVFVMEAMWMRFIPAVRELVELVRGGAVGDARMATLELGHPFIFDRSSRVFEPRGGGALLDLGVYPVSLALLLFGPPTRLQSQAVLGETGVDEQVTALLAHEGGRQSVLGASIRCRLSNAAAVMGTEGWIRSGEPLYRPESLTIARVPKMGAPARSGSTRPPWLDNPRLRSAARRVRAALARARRAGEREIVRRCRGNGYEYEAEEVMRCLRTGELESPLMPLGETLRVMQVLDEIRRAWGTG